jgi:alpha-2-macroglobulin
MTAVRQRLLLLALFVLPLIAVGACGSAQAECAAPAPPPAGAWREVDRLLDEQKLAEAAKLVDAIELRARAAADDAEVARALVRSTQIALALGGFETAVEALRRKPWPEAPLARATVELYDAHALHAYLAVYGWEIAQRERVTGGAALDLRQWTRDQIAAEADRAFGRAWAQREALGGVPSAASALLAPNDYPPGIRPTLRDAVAYLWSERLADSSGWSPAELQELWKLDLAALVDGTTVEPTQERLGDESLHPLVKLAAILGDLERWHRSRDEPEAALEARLERSRILFDVFAAEEDRARIRAALADALPEFRAVPWWAMGMSRLAAFWRQGPEADAIVRARAIAGECERRFPGTPGALACRSERQEIEAPAYQLQAMAIDSAGQRSIEIQHRNLERLHLRAFRLPVESYEATPVAHRGWSDERLRPLLRSAPVAEWTVELPPTADFRDHRSFATPPLAALGRYLIVASADAAFEPRRNQLQAVELTLSDIVLLHDWAGGPGGEKLALRALSGARGTPFAGVGARLYAWQWERQPQLVAERATDAAGFVAFDAPGEARRGGGFAVVVRSGDDEARWEQSYWPWHERPAHDSASTLLFTDRAIYRPGQTLYWKSLTYEGARHEGNLRAVAGRAVTVRLLDPNGESVAAATATTNGFGTASGALAIPAGRLLGDWRLETDAEGAVSIAVEEYKRPTFELTLAAPAGEPRLNRPVEIAGEARYYFGLPVGAGRVAWRVVREPIWEWSGRGFGRFWAPPAPPRTIASGIAEPDADGRFAIRFTPEADERERAGCACFRFTVEAELTDEGGETRGGRRSFALGWVGVRLTLVGDPFLVGPASERTWRLRRDDLDAQPRPGATRWRIVELAQPETAPLPADLPALVDPARESFATAGDRLRPRWADAPATRELLAGWAERREVARGELAHGDDGAATLSLPALASGAYRLVAESRDAHGETATLEHPFVVVTPAARGASPFRLGTPLELRFERPEVAVGATARLFVHSGLPGQSIVVEIAKRGEVVERRLLAAGDGPHWIDLPVTAAERGGFGARAAIVADHQIVQRQAAVTVPWDDKELTVELASFRDRLEPGQHETYRVTVKDAEGRPLGAEGAELLAAMYDRSLDLFRPHVIPLGASLWPAYGAPEALQHALGGRGAVWQDGRDGWALGRAPSYRADAFVAIDPYGIGGPGARGPRLMTMRAGAAVETAAAPQAAMDKVVVGGARESAPSAAGTPPPTPRQNFAETALWQPHLVTDATGGAAIEFRVPESLTSWKLWISAWTRELASGYLEREVQTVKELMVRPYLPRFVREGDAAELKVVVQNAATRELAGEVRLAIVDPDDDRDLSAEFGLPAGGGRAPFAAAPGQGADVAFPIRVPAGVRPLAFRVEARAGTLADGELRPLPVLPSRLRLTQSRFVAVRGGERRELTFEDLTRNDPSRVNEQLVVTLDGQLFYGMLGALPYLVDYPYECTEQTMNRFVSTAILGSLFDRHPAVAAMAKSLSQRETRWERFDATDPNRRMALEESPWLRQARGGTAADERLLRVLDPAVARAVRADALAKLAQAQLPSGAFPWFPGGPPSPYMTLYLMAGFARAAEFGAAIPGDMVQRGWRYLASEIERDWWQQAIANDCCWELLTFANYVASTYPDPAAMGDLFPVARRREILDFSFRHWKEHAPQSKLQLALTLARMQRPADARLVLDAVMDSAKSDRDLGTYWAPEERAWLWYNDTTETHAWALRTLSEIAPADARREGLVQWLFLDKKLGHWKSTRATAEVLYSLAHYLESTKLLGAREELAVTIGGRTTEFVFEPDRFTGKKHQIVVTGDEIVPARDATTVVDSKSNGLAFASATWQFSTEELPAEARGDLFHVERSWFRRVKQGKETTLVPLAEGERLAVGDELEIQLAIRARAAAEYVHLRDPRPAGLEPDGAQSGWRWDLGLAYYEETRDSGSNFFFERLPAGEITLKYRLRANVAGTFRAAPAVLQSMYAPEFVAYSAGARLRIAPR